MRSLTPRGSQGGQYDVEIAWNGVISTGSDSVTAQILMLTDRSGDLTITSPITQDLADALVIAGSLKNGGNDGIQIQVDGHRLAGYLVPSISGRRIMIQNGDGVFSQKVSVTQPDDYTVKFADTNGAITTITFHVVAPTTATTIPTVTTVYTVRTTQMVTYTPIPTPTRSPLPVAIVIGALGIALLVAVRTQKRP